MSREILTFGLITILIAVCTVLAVMAGLWTLWCWVMPQLWPTGPAGFTEPGFWVFTVAWVLVSWLGRAIFGRMTVQASGHYNGRFRNSYP